MNKKETLLPHSRFKTGQGYGSGEKESDYQKHTSEAQYGDNPLPASGGNYRKPHAGRKRKGKHSA